MSNKFGQYMILAVGALGLAALPAAADTPCATAALSSYLVSGFTCSVGDLDFSDFSFNTGGTDPVTAAGVGVTPVTSPDGPGLDFDPSGFVSGDGLSQDVMVGFTVTAAPGVLIDDIYMGFGNVTTSGTGTALYTENFCGGPEDACSLFVEAPTTSDTNAVNLKSTDIGGPVSSLNITKDLTLQTGTDGLAATSSFLNEYSTVPEPRAVSLVLGLGLLAGFVFFKRRQVAQS